MSYLLRFELLDDLQRPGCALCRAEHRVSWEYLRGLLATDINDTHVREQLVRAGGLCANHLYFSVEVAEATDDAFGMALLVEFLVEAGTKALRRARQRSLPGRRIRPLGLRLRQPTHWARPETCPACQEVAVVVDGYADLLVAEVGEGDIHHALRATDGGLCLPHALHTLARAPTAAAADPVVEACTRRADRIQQALGELIRKHASAYQDEPVGREATSWRQAPSWLAGRLVHHLPE